MRCKNCHYSLSGLTEHRCPECGRAFDPNDRSTFISASDAPKMRWPSFALGSLALVMWLLFELQRMPYRPPHDMSTFLGGPEKQGVRFLIGVCAVMWLACAVWLLNVIASRRSLR